MTVVALISFLGLKMHAAFAFLKTALCLSNVDCCLAHYGSSSVIHYIFTPISITYLLQFWIISNSFPLQQYSHPLINILKCFLLGTVRKFPWRMKTQVELLGHWLCEHLIGLRHTGESPESWSYQGFPSVWLPPPETPGFFYLILFFSETPFILHKAIVS